MYSKIIQENDVEQECELTFVGFLLFENQIKEGTLATIQELQLNSFETIMITGDNLYTAVNVGYASGIVPKNADLYLGIFNQENNNIDVIDFKSVDRVNIVHPH